MANLPSRLSLPGCVLAYADLGTSEPAVLFLHGAGADHSMFADQAAAVQTSGRRTVVLDLRAHGLSRPNSAPLTSRRLVEDVEALIRCLAIDRPVLVGHSLGGNLAQALVRRQPGKYSGLAVLDSTWNYGPLTRREKMLLRLAGAVLALIPAALLPAAMAKAVASSKRARAEALRAFARIPKQDVLRIWRATRGFVGPDPAYRTPVPLLLARGGADRTGNISSAMPAWAAAEGIREHVVPGAGHLVTLDAPDIVNSLLIDFLNQVDSRP